MRQNPWQAVLDELYQMGGQAEFPSRDTEEPLDQVLNLVEQADLPEEDVRKASITLQKMNLAVSSTIGNFDDDEPTRNELILTGEGYSFAHDRQQEKRNIRSNRSVVLLTVVLAFVGMAQATALTATVSEDTPRIIALIVTAGAALMLIVIFTALHRAGQLDIKEFFE